MESSQQVADLIQRFLKNILSLLVQYLYVHCIEVNDEGYLQKFIWNYTLIYNEWYSIILLYQPVIELQFHAPILTIWH